MDWANLPFDQMPLETAVEPSDAPETTSSMSIDHPTTPSVELSSKPEVEQFQQNHKASHNPEHLLSLFRSLNNTPEVRENYVRAPLGYPGGKSKSVKQIIPFLPYRGGYCEVFGGSASILLARHSSDLEIYNDRYGGIVSFYRCLRDPFKCQKLIERLELTVHSREEFIWCKETWEDVTDDVERAARWYYMHQNSFGQQERNFGRAGKGGKGQHGNALRNNLKFFAPVHDRIRNVQIENLDWRHCLSDFDHHSMVFYLDPTYVKYAKGAYVHNMTTEDHHEMIDRIQHLDGFVALSGYDDEETRAIYNKYPWSQILTWQQTTSSVALAFSDTNNRAGMEDSIKRHKVTESLWIREN